MTPVAGLGCGALLGERGCEKSCHKMVKHFPHTIGRGFIICRGFHTLRDKCPNSLVTA